MSRKTRKLIWSVPLVAVFAVIGALAIFAAQTPGSVFAHGAPGAVTDLALKVESQTENQADPGRPPPPAGRLTVTGLTSPRTPLTWMLLTDSAPGDKQTYSDTTMWSRAKLRYYRVFAVNSSGTGSSV